MRVQVAEQHHALGVRLAQASQSRSGMSSSTRLEAVRGLPATA